MSLRRPNDAEIVSSRCSRDRPYTTPRGTVFAINGGGNSRLASDQTSKAYTHREDEDWLHVRRTWDACRIASSTVPATKSAEKRIPSCSSNILQLKSSIGLTEHEPCGAPRQRGAPRRGQRQAESNDEGRHPVIRHGVPPRLVVASVCQSVRVSELLAL
jgi:hypothetical protein